MRAVGRYSAVASTAQANESKANSVLLWHSQTVITCHPNSFNLATAASSLAVFAANFACQKSVLVLGMVA
jgi:hypothetical protein